MKLEAIHSYGDYELLRYRRPGSGEKSLEWEHRGEEGVWLSGLGGTRLDELPLYMEDQVRMGAAAGEIVVVVESESSADAFARVGVYATTWAGGAQAPQLHRLADVLAAAQVLVIPDHDPAGLACGHEVVAALKVAGARVSLMVPELPGQDARDLLAQRGGRAFADHASDSRRYPSAWSAEHGRHAEDAASQLVRIVDLPRRSAVPTRRRPPRTGPGGDARSTSR